MLQFMDIHNVIFTIMLVKYITAAASEHQMVHSPPIRRSEHDSQAAPLQMLGLNRL